MNITDTQKAKIIKGTKFLQEVEAIFKNTKKPTKTPKQINKSKFLQEVEAMIIKGTKKPHKTPEQVNRTRFLQEVEAIVNNDRASQYGGAEDSFLAIASLWNSYLGIKNILAEGKVISCLDVALMMDLLKTARICSNPLHYDSWIDKAGYSACGGALVGKPMPEVSKTLPEVKTE